MFFGIQQLGELTALQKSQTLSPKESEQNKKLFSPQEDHQKKHEANSKQLETKNPRKRIKKVKHSILKIIPKFFLTCS